jgi:predicted dehydrogenase
VIRIAAVGHGDIARRRHFLDLEELGERAQLVAIAGRDESSLERTAHQFGVPSWYTDADEMLGREDIDAVLVLTPPKSHGRFAEKAIAAGKHVLVEKPLVMTFEEAAELLEALKAQQLKAPTTFMPLPDVETPEHRLVARLLAEGIVGEATSVECHLGHRGPTHADWFYRQALAGGGVLFDLGIYAVSAVVSLLGPARNVTALCSRRFGVRTLDDGTVVEPDVEDSALVNLWLDNNTAVTINANWNGYVTHHATRSRVTVIGREGSLHFGVADGGIYVHRADNDYGRITAPSDEVHFDGYSCRRIDSQTSGGPATIVGNFVTMIEGGETSVRRLEMQVHVMEIIFEAYRSGAANELRTLTTRF